MSSSLYLGVPGAGKTFGVVRYVATPALERGQRVVTNIPLNELALCDHLGKNLDGLIKLVTEDEINAPNFWFTAEGIGKTITEAGDCIIIDECHAFYGPEKKIKADNEVFRAIRLQRKYTGGSGNFSTDIIFVTQDYNDVTKSLRSVCGSMYFMQKMLAVGDAGSYRVDIYSDCRKSPERGLVINKMFGKYEPAYYALYNSYSSGVGGYSSDAAGVEVVTDDRLNVWNSKIGIGPFKVSMKQAKYIAIGVAVVSFALLGWLFYRVLSKPVVPVATPPAVSAVATSAAAPPSAPASVPAAAPVPAVGSSKLLPDESPEYRLVGFYQLGGNKLAVVSDSKGKYRYLVSGAFSDTDFQLIQAGPATHIKVKGQVIAPWTGSSAIQNNSTAKMEQSK